MQAGNSNTKPRAQDCSSLQSSGLPALRGQAAPLGPEDTPPLPLGQRRAPNRHGVPQLGCVSTFGSAPHLETPVSTRDFTCVHRARSARPGHTRTPRPSEPGRGMTPLGRPVDSPRRAKSVSAGLTRLLGRGRGRTPPFLYSFRALHSGVAARRLCTSWDAGDSLQWAK